MLKGIQKNVIMIRPRSSNLFDCAYFIMKDSLRPSRCDKNEMIKEANRIISDSGILKKNKRKKTVSRLIMFILGLTLGALSVGAFWLFFSLPL